MPNLNNKNENAEHVIQPNSKASKILGDPVDVIRIDKKTITDSKTSARNESNNICNNNDLKCTNDDRHLINLKFNNLEMNVSLRGKIFIII